MHRSVALKLCDVNVNVNVKNNNCKTPIAVQIMNPEMIHETKKSFQLTTESSQRPGSGDVAGKFIPQFSSRNRKWPITDSDEPRRTDNYRASVADERRHRREGMSVTRHASDSTVISTMRLLKFFVSYHIIVELTNSGGLCSEDNGKSTLLARKYI